MNEKVNAKIHLEYVVEHGNTMSIVEEAKELLDRQFYIDRRTWRKKMQTTYNHCVKNKAQEKCQTKKCLTYNKYNLANMQMPCPFYRTDDCGFLGNLQEVNGKKIRRQYFEGICWGYWIAVIYIVLFVTFCYIKVGRDDFSLMEFVICFFMTLVFWIFLCILRLCNRFLIGRCVCVINEQGIYSNQGFRNWNDIKELEYHIGSRGRTYYDCCAVTIRRYKKEIIIPHAPRYLLKLAKKYNSDIDTFLRKEDKRDIIIIICLVTALLIIFGLLV